MAPIILSASPVWGTGRPRARTPSAKERRRAAGGARLAEGLSAEQVAETFQVSRQTVYNWVNRFLRRDDLESRVRLLDAPRPGRPPSIAEVIDPWIAAAFAGDPRELGYHATVWTAELLQHHWSTLMGSRPPSRASAWRSHAWVLRWKRPRHELAARPETWCEAKRGLKRGLKDRTRRVILMLDETIVTETPPLYNCYGPVRPSKCGCRSRGARQPRAPWGDQYPERRSRVADHRGLDRDGHEAFLQTIRAHWRGWNLVVFEDRASQHKAARVWAQERLRSRPGYSRRATPELNAMDHLWRHAKRETLGDRATLSIEASALAACQY